VPLKVLLADDNMTAQRMGSKILTDAGHQVIAVSNGAAAVKKIASEKPELLILDVFMPGYSGLEVCEKVKNDPATAHLPVILTVTNMEPFNQQDGTRVRADGLMIKPFEATDLLAVVQKFEAKSAKAAVATADYAQTVKMKLVEEIKDASYEEWKSEAADEPEAQKMQVSDEIASAPALGFDETPSQPAPQPVPLVEPAAPASAFAVDAPAFGAEANTASAFDATPAPMEWEPSSAASPVESAPLPEAPAEIAPPAELEFTSAPQVGEVKIERAAELEVTSSTGDIVVAQDPALVTNADEMSQFATSVGVENPEEIVVGIAMPGLTGAEEPPAPDEAPPADAAPDTVRMPAYEEPAPPAIEQPAPVEVDMQRAFSAGSRVAAAAPAPFVEPEPPPAHPAADTAPMPDHLVAQFAAELDKVHLEREAMARANPPVEEAASIESSMEVAAEIPASQLDEERIAAAVNRALEKYKDGLREELIATIIRELKG
jgi:CheY-like chemotaxis protein